MIEKIRYPKASEKEISLYSLLGESLCAVQILEDALSHSIVIKKIPSDQKKKADELLKKQRFYTFGRAIKIAKEESLLPKPLENQLSNLLEERNWLIHESITNDKDNYKSDAFFNNLYERTKAITLKAQNLKISIELDLIEYSEKQGIDMFRVKNEMNKNYGLHF